MHGHRHQIVGLLGFILAGFIFIAIGVIDQDILTIVASVIWVGSCIIWMIPLVKPGE